MKQKNTRLHQIRIIAAVFAFIAIAGGAAGLRAIHSTTHAQTVQETDTETPKKSSDDSVISSGGTITSSQMSDNLGLKDTAVRLTVEEVLAESGDSVTAGTQLYSITSDSLTKAEKQLRSELQTAQNKLLEEKSSYLLDKSKASILYKSELLLGDSAKTDYEKSLSSLDSSLKQALNSYQEAVDTINNTPSEISEKQAELDSQQTYADSLQEQQNTIQNEVNEAKTAYNSALQNYNTLVSEYNAAAGAVRYIGNSLGKDTSGIQLV